MKRKFSLFVIAVAVMLPAAVIAQTPLTRDQMRALGVDPDSRPQTTSSSQVPSPAWGTASDIAVRVPGVAFTPRAGVALWGSSGKGERYRLSQTIGGTTVTSEDFWDAPLDLPAGAKLTGLRADFCDTSGTVAGITAFIARVDEPAGAPLVAFPPSLIVSSGAAGCQSLFADLTANNEVIDHLNHTYFVRFHLTAPDFSNQIRGAVVFYRLQVSPAPGTATFADVPTTHLFYQYIEALAAAGITSGCGGGNFCPDANLTRGQMAVFLAKALGLHWTN